MKKIAFLINPLAGEGKRFGLKSSDDLTLQNSHETDSIRIGKSFISSIMSRDSFRLILPDAGLYHSSDYQKYSPLLETKWSDTSSGEDTRNFVRTACDNGADLIVFVGGDGTARDVLSGVMHSVPVIGVPSGIKMYSSVFAFTWMDAVKELEQFISSPVEFEEKEILDYDFESNSLKLFGTVRGILSPAYNQDPKQVYPTSGASGIGSAIVSEMTPGTSYIIGPGTTCNSILEELGISGAELLHFKIVKGGRLIAEKAGEIEILEAMKNGDYRIIISPIGGMGILVGRGNYELSDEVLLNLIPEKLVVIAVREKIITLEELVIIGSSRIYGKFDAYIKVRTGIDEFMMKRLKVINAQ